MSLKQNVTQLGVAVLLLGGHCGCATHLATVKTKPARLPTSVATDNGNYLFTSAKPVDVEHDPSRYDLLPTDTLRIRGRFFKTRTATGGIGAPLVAVGRTEDPQFRQHYKLRRIYAPVTA